MPRKRKDAEGSAENGKSKAVRKEPEKSIESGKSKTVRKEPETPASSGKSKTVRKRKASEKEKSDGVQEANSPQSAEKHVVIKILYQAQTNEAFHTRYIKELQNQYAKIGHDAFLAMFISCLKQLIAKEESLAYYANIGLQFMAKFATSFDSEDMHAFSEAVFNWVLKTVSLSPNIRSRLCRFVNLLLNSLGSNASLDDALFDNILKYMFDRLKDLYPTVRVQAIKALQRLQMPDDPDDAIVKIYTFHLASDPSGVVRQAVLTCLGRNIHTIPFILDRLWDIDEKVRRHVYVHMANYPVKTYKVAHRLTFLEQGLNDRSDSVRKIVTGIMIPQWLESYSKNYLAFLSGLKLDANDVEIDRFRSTARLALFEIFKTQSADDLINALSLENEEDSTYPKCIPFEKLTIESSLFWWALIVYFQQDERRSDYLEMIIPELSLFCGYVQKYNDNTIGEEKEEWEMIISQSVLFNLIEILSTFDYGDEIGRQHLRTLAIHLLTTNPCNENIIKSLITICEKLIPNSDDRLQVYVDVIRSLVVDQDLLEKFLNFSDSNVIEALERDPNLKVQVSSLKLKLFELKEEESKFVKLKDYANVSRISEQITLCQDQLVNLVRPLMTSGSNSLQQKRITKELQIKALKLAFHGVCSRSVSKLNPAMCQLYTDFIRLKIESSDMDVRNWALKCGATFSLLYEQLAKDVFTALNKQFFDHHHIDVWTTSVSAMFQLIDRYGFSYFDEENSSNEMDKPKEKSKKSRLLYNVSEYMEDTEDESNVEKGGVTIKGLIYLFGHFMDTCDDIHLMSALIDGFGLLILHGIFIDEKLVSRLILLYFNPTTEAEINQILSIFFETLIHQKKQECLEAALIQTLTKIIEATSESPLHDVKIETVLHFMITSTLPVYCKTGVKLHDNMALSLLKWMNNNSANREVLKTTSKEILKLEISDDIKVRQTLQDYVDQLLELPMDSKTEKNLKSFKELMQGNRTKDIQFSSVAPANGVDGELEGDHLPSDDESSNRNDEEKLDDGANMDDNSDIGSSNDIADKSSHENGIANENGEKCVNDENADKDKESEPTDESVNEANDSIVEPATVENVKENASETIEQSKTNRRKRSLPADPSDNINPPKVPYYYSSNEDTTDNETSVHQIQLQVIVHNQPVISNEDISSSPEKRRARVRQLIAEQQQNSPDIQSAPLDIRTGRALRKKTVPPPRSHITPISEPIKSGKRKVDSLKSSQSEGDSDEKTLKTKKSKLEVFSETPKSKKDGTDKVITDKNNKKTNSNANEKQSPVEKTTRRNRGSDAKASADKKLSDATVQNDKQLKGKTAVRKKSTSDTSEKATKKVERTEKTSLRKKTVPNESEKSSKRLSDSQPSPRSNSRTRTSMNNTKIDDTIVRSSSRKTTPVVPTPPTATRSKNPLPSSTRQRQVASEPPIRKIISRVAMKNTVSPKKQKETASKITSSLSNLDNLSNIDKPQHRTRRALAKEFMVNNVITRNRSIDGVKLLQKPERLSSTNRKSSIGMDMSTEKPVSTSKSKKIVDVKLSTPTRPRRMKSLDKK